MDTQKFSPRSFPLTLRSTDTGLAAWIPVLKAPMSHSVSYCYSHSLPFLVYIPYSVPFFLHYLECTLHAFIPQTFILYLYLQYSDSVTLLRAEKQTLKIHVADDTGVHPKNKEDSLPNWRQALQSVWSCRGTTAGHWHFEQGSTQMSVWVSNKASAMCLFHHLKQNN